MAINPINDFVGRDGLFPTFIYSALRLGSPSDEPSTSTFYHTIAFCIVTQSKTKSYSKLNIRNILCMRNCTGVADINTTPTSGLVLVYCLKNDKFEGFCSPSDIIIAEDVVVLTSKRAQNFCCFGFNPYQLSKL